VPQAQRLNSAPGKLHIGVHRLQTPSARALKPTNLLVPIAALLAAMVSIQVGAASAAGLVAAVGVEGASVLRLAISAVLLALVLRPWQATLTAGTIRPLLLYGLAMAAMNLLFYAAIVRIPLGVAAALEFLGPLAVGLYASRRAVDVWLALAAAGGLALLLLAGWTGEPLDPLGVAFALAAAACWAVYIVCGQTAGATHGRHTVSLGMIIAAVAVLPFGAPQAATVLWSPALLPVAIGVALLSSALPFALEMLALRQLSKPTYGTLISVEPAIGAVAGYLMLSQSLSLQQCAAIGLIMCASAGAAWTAATASVPADGGGG
jgi:inner membrane transporter RhtA